MQPFLTHKGRIAVVPGDNIDTDRIIPARFLSRVTRSGYGELLFHDVRGPDFVLDQPDAAGATIMVVGSNFGCGSSREHAVWAIYQAGYRAVIAKKTFTLPGFGDIFRQNAANYGLLLAEIDEASHEVLVNAGSGAVVDVDLTGQVITSGDHDISFEINQVTKEALMKGLDPIGSTLLMIGDIEMYEASHDNFVPAI